MKDVIADVTAYMREHADRDLSIEELAARYGYSKFHFSREFKKAIGVTPNEYWAAVKMERSLAELQRSSSILNAHLRAGYQSTGTFVTAFHKATGFTPGQYKEELRKLHILSEAKRYEREGGRTYTHYSFNRNDPQTYQAHRLEVSCHMPDDFKGLIFVGMFTKPLPAEAPILGKAMTRTNRCVIDQIPDGEYYVLACAIRSSANPLVYFQSKHWLRDLCRTPYYFPLEADTEVRLALREEDPTDPAIPLSPVKLLVDALRRRE